MLYTHCTHYAHVDICVVTEMVNDVMHCAGAHESGV